MLGKMGLGELLIILVVFALPALWVYRDAERRGMSGPFWVLAMLFTNILGGLFIYLAIRDRLSAD